MNINIELIKEDLSKLQRKVLHLKDYGKVVKVETSVMANPYWVLEELKTKIEDNVIGNAIKYFTVSVLFFAGLRASEFSELNKMSFDFINRRLAIKTKKQKQKVVDYVPLTHVPNTLLQFWYLILHNNDEKRLFKERVAVWKRVKSFFEDWELEGYNITAHSLRHALGLFLYEITKDIRLVAEVLRHRNIKNTLIYTKLSKDEIAKRLQKIIEE